MVLRKTVKRLLERRRFDIYAVTAISLLVLISRGATEPEQTAFIHGIFGEYVVEETVASTIPTERPLSENSTIFENQDQLGPSRGGASNGENGIDIQTTGENSVIAYTPVSEDYSAELGLDRSSIIEYTVLPGDVLSFIASDYNVSQASIIWANNLRDADSIKPGLVLKIPPVTGVIHKVQKGDTVSSIAKKYGIDVEKILDFNGLPKNGALQIGEELTIPDGKISTPKSYASTVSTATFSHLPDLGGYFALPTTGSNWAILHGRNGIDIANAKGTPIYAAAAGTVRIADATGYNGGFGSYIVIGHPNGTETLYAHASRLTVSAGETVQRGQLIALMGSTGRSTGSHLHFEAHGAKNPYCDIATCR